MQLIEVALQNARVKTLYDDVNARTPITIVEDNSGSWGSTTNGGRTIITIAPTIRPEASLAHELLHAELKYSGYHQYATLCSMNEDQRRLKEVCEALDNELQHQRMFEKFSALGFKPVEFYHDDDIDAYINVRRSIKRMNREEHPGDFLMQYLTVLAPGGAGSEEERERLKQFFKTRCSSDTWRILREIEAEFQSWRIAEALDPGPTIASILRTLGCFNLSWVGRCGDFPASGYFVDKEFSAEQLWAWHHDNRSAKT